MFSLNVILTLLLLKKGARVAGGFSEKAEVALAQPTSEVVVFEHSEFRGANFSTPNDQPNLGFWHDRISSILVVSGTWRFCEHINYEGRCVRLHSLPLRDYGFDYEAYTLPRDSRFSDSGGRWAGVVAGQRPPQKWLEGEFDIQEFRAFVSRGCAAQGVKAMSLLTHPCHWDAPCP